MLKQVNKSTQVHVKLPARLVRRLDAIVEDQGLGTRTNAIELAVSEYISRVDMDHSAPDFVLDRMTEILNVLIPLQMDVREIKRRLDDES